MTKLPKPSLGEAGHHAERAAREARPWVVRLGRLGYAAKGVVHATVGLLAAQAAIGAGGGTTDPQGVFGWILQTPSGRVLLGAIAVGLAGYAFWSVVQGLMDTDHKGSDAKGIVTRTGFVITGLISAGLALAAARLVLDRGAGPGGDASARDCTGWLISQPFGQWLVGVVVLVVIGAGLYHLYQASSANFLDDLKLGEMSRDEAMWTTRVGRLGFAADGVAVGIIGGFLVAAAIHAQPQEARGLGGALEALARQPYGPWLLGIVGVGLIAYGLFMLIQARYRRMVIR